MEKGKTLLIKQDYEVHGWTDEGFEIKLETFNNPEEALEFTKSTHLQLYYYNMYVVLREETLTRIYA